MKTASQAARTAMQALTTHTPTPPALNPKFAEWLGFQTFNDPQLEKVVVACQEWADAFQDKAPARWLSLIGVSGTGKTHCARRLWKWARSRSHWTGSAFVPHAIYWPHFVQALRSGMAFELRDDLKKWPVLLLDDIGGERDASGFATEELNTLLGCRMGKWTLLTSNLHIEALKNLDARISSRLIRDTNICVGIETKDFAER